MKYLGVDYGSKRVGIALSDEAGDFVYPFSVLENENQNDLVQKIVIICKWKKVEEIVVGESKNFKMKENDIMKEILPFVEELKEKIGLPVRMHPEFLSSQEAERLQGKNKMLDASAAAIILKSYLDMLKNKG